MRDELLTIEQFESPLEARVLVQDWREECNSYPPHSALGMPPPAEFAHQWKAYHQFQLK
jgi:putative transposase